MKSKHFKRKTIVICSILSVIALFSIGFASWIVNNKYVESKINIEIGKINNFNQFEFGDISTFTFNKDGVLVDEVYQAKGDIQIKFLINLKSGLALQDYKQGNLTLQFLWESTNSNLNLNEYLSTDPHDGIKFSYSYLNYDDAQFIINSNPSTITFNKESNIITAELETNISSVEILNNERAYFIINFAYDFTNVFNTFETSIYNNLAKDNGTFFKFSLGVVI